MKKTKRQKTNNEKLKEIMKAKGLDQKDIAEHTGYSLSMVKGWCATPGTKRYRPMMDRAMKTLRLALQTNG